MKIMNHVSHVTAVPVTTMVWMVLFSMKRRASGRAVASTGGGNTAFHARTGRAAHAERHGRHGKTTAGLGVRQMPRRD